MIFKWVNWYWKEDYNGYNEINDIDWIQQDFKVKTNTGNVYNWALNAFKRNIKYNKFDWKCKCTPKTLIIHLKMRNLKFY